MTHIEQASFIQELCNNVRDDLLMNVKKHPIEWDGHELRELIAKRFSHVVFSDQAMKGKRKKDFVNYVLVENLL